MSRDSESFSDLAKSWNSLPGKHDEAKRFINEVRSNFTITKNLRILDFGCGTGLNGLGFINDVQTVAFLDTSTGMLEQVKTALKELKASNFELYNDDISKIKNSIKPFDIIMTSLSFHHIEDIDSVLQCFYELTNPGGKVFLVDLYPEDGSFHGSMKVPHNGFDPDELKEHFVKFGYKNLTHKKLGDSHGYPTFIIIAEK